MSLQWLVSIIRPDGSSLHHPDVTAEAVYEYAADHMGEGDRVQFYRGFMDCSGVQWVRAR